MSASVAIVPRGPFSLQEAARFFHDWPGGASDGEQPAPDGHLHLAFALDHAHGDGPAVGACVRQKADGSVAVTVTEDPCVDPDRAAAQAARILSLDHDGSGFVPARIEDPVLRELVAAHPGLRPVLFASPYEAGVWFLVGHRIQMRQTAAVKARIARELGDPVEVCGTTLHAFPPPARLVGDGPLPGVPDFKRERLRALAEATVAGRLEAETLRGLLREQAIARLQALPGVGPFIAEGILLRGAGTRDEPALSEARNAAAIAHAYGLRGAISPHGLAEIAERWRPYRTWASVLLRVHFDAAVAVGAAEPPRMRARRAG